MTEGQVRDVVRSFDGSLDEVRREQAWRAVQRGLLATPEPLAARPRWPFAVIAAAAAFAIAWFAWPRGAAVGDGELPTLLAAGANQRASLERDGVAITLHGPGAAAIHRDAAGIHIDVKGGTLLAERGDTAPALIVAAGESTTTSRDRTFAVRVQPGTVIFGAGEQARAIVERHTVTLAPPSQSPPPPSEPTVVEPAPVARPTAPRIERTPSAPDVSAPAAEPQVEPAPPPTPLDARQLYQLAEAALKTRDRAAAKFHLAHLIVEFPSDALVDAAHYDLALIAIAESSPAKAREHIRWLLANARDANLRASAKKLEAKLATE